MHTADPESEVDRGPHWSRECIDDNRARRLLWRAKAQGRQSPAAPGFLPDSWRAAHNGFEPTYAVPPHRCAPIPRTGSFGWSRLRLVLRCSAELDRRPRTLQGATGDQAVSSRKSSLKVRSGQIRHQLL